jgi:hypothetical protein
MKIDRDIPFNSRMSFSQYGCNTAKSALFIIVLAPFYVFAYVKYSLIDHSTAC